MIKESKFCTKCGQKLREPLPFIEKAKYHEFEDGYYCDGCAREKVRKAREVKKY